MRSSKQDFSVIGLAFASIGYYLKLISKGKLHLRRQNLSTMYKIADGGTYAVFRETFSEKEYGRQEVTLIIGFQLKLIGRNKLLHWLFQRLCVLDTPIWVGFAGFKTKYWLVEPDTKAYLGLYRYQGQANAQTYADYICAVLRPVSVRDSVWYKIEAETFLHYTNSHKV